LDTSNKNPHIAYNYQVPLAKHVPLENQSIYLLPPQNPDELPKGVGEVVLNPIIPSIANAMYHATGKRFFHLPMSQNQIKEALS
jgi:CO/xanthine dehydrogenase Mo-binding subunit